MTSGTRVSSMIGAGEATERPSRVLLHWRTVREHPRGYRRPHQERGGFSVYEEPFLRSRLCPLAPRRKERLLKQRLPCGAPSTSVETVKVHRD